MSNNMKEEIKGLFRKPYLSWVVAIFVIYIVLNILLSGFYDTIPLIAIYAKTVNWLKLGFSLLLTLIIGMLVSLTMVLTYVKYKERKQCKEGFALSGVGGIGGLVVGICPLCVTGIFPLLFGLFGTGFSFASLPFQGIEIQIGVITVLITSLYLLTKQID